MPPFEENRLAGAPRSPPGRIAVAALLALLVLAALLGPSPAPPPSPEAPRDAALAHLAALHGLGQGASGAVPAPYLVEAAAAAGLDPGAWPSAAHPALDGLEFPAPDGALIGLLRPAYAWAVAGRDLGDVTGRDVRSEILAAFDGVQFGVPDQLHDDMWALLALHAGGMDMADLRVQAAAQALAEAQRGGWSWSAGGPAETDTTGMALVALQTAGVPGDAGAALAFLLTTRTADGGWSLRPGEAAGNCDSTVWGLRGLAALGTTDAAGWAFLLSLQGPDGGFSLQPGLPANPLCTAEAATLLGLAVSGEVPNPA